MNQLEEYDNNAQSNSVPPQRDVHGGNYTGDYTGNYTGDHTGDYTGAYRRSYSEDGVHDQDYSSEDSWSSDNRSPVIGTGRDASPLKHPGTPLPKPSLKQQSSTDDSTDSTIRSNKTSYSIYIILLAIVIASGVLLLSNNHQIVVIDPNHPNLISPPINWWDRYNNKCCLMSNNTIGIYGRTTGDCTADGKCYDYLESWLLCNGQTFYNSTWSNRCCYEFRPIGSDLQTFCSYTCLNTEKTKQVFSNL